VGYPPDEEGMIRIKKSSKEEALYALKFAGWVLFTIFTLGLLFWGAVRVSSIVPGSKVAGWAAVAFAFAILLVTIERWGKLIWGLFPLAVFNALIMAGSGHNFSYPPFPFRDGRR
jgi:hypothetical protein